jgi:hypothetical protein
MFGGFVNYVPTQQLIAWVGLGIPFLNTRYRLRVEAEGR